MIKFTFEGRELSCSRKARFLVEEANGTSSYTLVCGFAAEPDKAIEAYGSVQAGRNKRKRLLMVDDGRRVVVARSS